MLTMTPADEAQMPEFAKPIQADVFVLLFWFSLQRLSSRVGGWRAESGVPSTCQCCHLLCRQSKHLPSHGRQYPGGHQQPASQVQKTAETHR